MLVSGVVAGIAAGIAFGGDWHRLGSITIRWWPLLAAAATMRLWTAVAPESTLFVYVLALIGVVVVATANVRLPGAALIAVGSLANLVVVVLNSGMPYDVSTVAAVGAPPPHDTLHVPLKTDSVLPFLSDVIPVGFGHAVYSLGDFVIAFGGFLVPFISLQPRTAAGAHAVRSANFAFFWMAQIISRFGDPITLVALTYVTYRATQSALLTAIAVGVASLPSALFGFFGGAIADAFGPKRAMFWCDVIRAAIVGGIPILLFLDAPLFVIFVAVFFAGIATAVFNPARGAVIPALLRRDQLARGNSLVYASDRAVEIGGALAGGALVAAIGDGAFYIDAMTFALSAVLLARIVLEEAIHRITWRTVWDDARAGLRFLREASALWANTTFSLFAQFANPVVNTLTPAFLIRRFGGNDALVGAVLYSGSEAAIALGAVVGSALLPRYLARFRKGRVLVVGFACTGGTIMAISLAPSYAAALALFVLLGLTNVLFYVPTITILQEATPQALTARVFGARIALTNLSWLPIIFLGGVIGDAIGVDVFMLIAGLVTLATAVVGAFIPLVRDVP